MTYYVGDVSISDRDEKQFGLTYYGELIEYIANDLDPDQVFSSDVLIEWAHDQGIEKIFDDKELENWAEDNGYVLE